MTDENTVAQETENPAAVTGAEKPVADATETAGTTEQKPAKPPEGYVPHQALHAERIKTRKLERDLAEERMWREQGNKRLEEIAKRFAPKEQEPDPEDVVGGIVHKIGKVDERLAAREQRDKEREEADRQKQQEQAVATAFQRGAALFKAQTPDFDAAYMHLWKDVTEIFVYSGYTEQEAQTLGYGYWRDIVTRAERDGVNPAERIYNLAKRRGYKPQKDADDKIETMNRGAKAASPLSSAGGKAPKNMTVESIAAMSEEDFSKLSDEDFRRAFGG